MYTMNININVYYHNVCMFFYYLKKLCDTVQQFVITTKFLNSLRGITLQLIYKFVFPIHLVIIHAHIHTYKHTLCICVCIYIYTHACLYIYKAFSHMTAGLLTRVYDWQDISSQATAHKGTSL